MNTHELAWAAGFVDGEGYFGCRNRRGKNDRRAYPNINLNIHQVDRRALDRVQAALGLGRVDGPYGPYSGNRKPHFQFVAGNFENVQAAIAMLWKWLSPVKREQARSVLLNCRIPLQEVSCGA